MDHDTIINFLALKPLQRTKIPVKVIHSIMHGPLKKLCINLYKYKEINNIFYPIQDADRLGEGS